MDFRTFVHHMQEINEGYDHIDVAIGNIVTSTVRDGKGLVKLSLTLVVPEEDIEDLQSDIENLW